jgi:hypothetical protein
MRRRMRWRSNIEGTQAPPAAPQTLNAPAASSSACAAAAHRAARPRPRPAAPACNPVPRQVVWDNNKLESLAGLGPVAELFSRAWIDTNPLLRNLTGLDVRARARGRIRGRLRAPRGFAAGQPRRRADARAGSIR